MISIALVSFASEKQMRLSLDAIQCYASEFPLEIWSASHFDGASYHFSSEQTPAEIMQEIVQTPRATEKVLIVFAGEFLQAPIPFEALNSQWVQVSFVALRWHILYPRLFQVGTNLKFSDPLGWFYGAGPEVAQIHFKADESLLLNWMAVRVENNTTAYQYQQERLADVLAQKTLNLKHLQSLNLEPAQTVVKKKWFKVVRQRSQSEQVQLQLCLQIARLSAAFQSQAPREVLALLQAELEQSPQLEQHPLKWLIQGEYARLVRPDVAEACYLQAMHLSQSPQTSGQFGELDLGLCLDFPTLRWAELQAEKLDFQACQEAINRLPRHFKVTEQLRLQILVQFLQSQWDDGLTRNYIKRLGREPAWLEQLKSIQEGILLEPETLTALLLKYAPVQPLFLQACLMGHQSYALTQIETIQKELASLWQIFDAQSKRTLNFQAQLLWNTHREQALLCFKQLLPQLQTGSEFLFWAEKCQSVGLSSWADYCLQRAYLVSSPQSNFWPQFQSIWLETAQQRLQSAQLAEQVCFVLPELSWECGADIALKTYIESFVYDDPCLLICQGESELFLQALAWAHEQFDADLLPQMLCFSELPELPEQHTPVLPWRIRPEIEISGIQPQSNCGALLSYVYQQSQDFSRYWIEVTTASLSQALRTRLHQTNLSAETKAVEWPARNQPQIPLSLQLISRGQAQAGLKTSFQSCIQLTAQQAWDDFDWEAESWYLILNAKEDLQAALLPFLADWTQSETSQNKDIVYFNAVHLQRNCVGLPCAALMRGKVLPHYYPGIPGIVGAWADWPGEKSIYFAEIHLGQHETSAWQEGADFMGELATAWSTLQKGGAVPKLPQPNESEHAYYRHSLEYIALKEAYQQQNWEKLMALPGDFLAADYLRARTRQYLGEVQYAREMLSEILADIDANAPIEHLFPRLSNLQVLNALNALPETEPVHVARLRKIKGT